MPNNSQLSITLVRNGKNVLRCDSSLAKYWSSADKIYKTMLCARHRRTQRTKRTFDYWTVITKRLNGISGWFVGVFHGCEENLLGTVSPNGRCRYSYNSGPTANELAERARGKQRWRLIEVSRTSWRGDDAGRQVNNRKIWFGWHDDSTTIVACNRRTYENYNRR